MKKLLSLIAVVAAALTTMGASATTYWLSGAYNSWSTSDSNTAFTDNGDGTHTLTMAEFYGEFKIITSGGGTWYGCTTTTLSLDTDYTLSTSGSNMTLPSSTDTYTNVVFTVTVSGSTLTLKVSAGGSTETATSYFLSGAYNSWISSIDSNYTFTSTSTDGVYTLSLSEFYGEFKIVTSPGSAWYGYGTIALDTEYTITTSGGNITLPSSSDTYTNVVFTLTVTSSALTLKVTAEGTKTTEMDYYLSGDFNSWAQMSSDYMFTSNGDGTYTLVTPSSGHTTSTGFKIMSSTQLWLGYASGYNIDYDTEYTFSASGNNTYLNTAPTADSLKFTLKLADEVYTLVVSQVEGETVTLNLSGEGTESSPYLISTASDWNNLADYMTSASESFTGKYFKVTADIDFTDDSIKSLGKRADGLYFDGTLDGGGYTFKGINTASDATYFGSLMSVVGENGYVHDLTAEGEASFNYQYCGALFGYNYGKLENITNKITVTSVSTYSSGMCGMVDGGSSMIGCVNEGSVTSSATYVAGLVARSYGGATYEKCVNRGTITYTGSTALSYVGGIICYCYYGTLTDCYNEGTIQATGSGTAMEIIAGVVAYPYASAYTDSTILYLKNCYNTGEIIGMRGLGGLISGSTNTASHVVLEDCYNTGNITANGTSGSSSYAVGGIGSAYFTGGTYRNCWNSGTITSGGAHYTGGIFGYYKGTASTSRVTEIVGCYNTGTIVGGSTYTGGLFGCIYNYTTVDSCYNLGTVTAASYTGGIAARLYGSSLAKITNCWNAAAIESTLNGAGGIVGYSYYKDTVDCCFNVGSIKAAALQAGGVAGYGGAVFMNVYNTGAVTGEQYVGGLVGNSRSSYFEMYNSYNAGEVSATTSYIGNIIGCSTANTSYLNESNVISGTYYLNALAPDSAAVDTISVGLSYAELAKLDLGSSWTAGDDYTYPRLTSLADNDYAKAYAAAVIPADGDSLSSITQGFYVGAPDGVTWTASPSVVEISGNNATFTETYTGSLVMTATSGDVSVSTTLTCNVTTVGISSLESDAARTVVGEKFYTTGGAQVAEPAEDSKAIYIVVKTYDDGTTETVKEVR